MTIQDLVGGKLRILGGSALCLVSGNTPMVFFLQKWEIMSRSKIEN